MILISFFVFNMLLAKDFKQEITRNILRYSKTNFVTILHLRKKNNISPIFDIWRHRNTQINKKLFFFREILMWQLFRTDSGLSVVGDSLDPFLDVLPEIDSGRNEQNSSPVSVDVLTFGWNWTKNYFQLE